MAAKILIVDDDPDIREALSMILESRGYQVVTAQDGIEGLATLK
jgi:CheY-like chemotaxis protein